MEGFALVMCIGAVIGMSLAIWSYTKSGRKWIDNLYSKTIVMMDGLMFIFSLGLIISSSFAIWLNTKSGQKWIDEL